AGQSLGQGVVQLARHALALARQGEVLYFNGVPGQLAIGGLQLCQQRLGLLARLHLAGVEQHVDHHEEGHGDGHHQPPGQRDSAIVDAQGDQSQQRQQDQHG
ncbi:hypothetical protein RZS08_65185, partial [Arthrospira platensis SPKY1]|nr:hypothetical protein [Arthrospira platensis SPKY1]